MHSLDVLRGLLETEGTVHCTGNSLQVMIICNTDLNLINVARELLTSLGIKQAFVKEALQEARI